MDRKHEPRRATREKLSNQTSRKNRKRRSYLGTRKAMTNKAAFSSELNWLLGDQDIFAADVFHGNSTWDSDFRGLGELVPLAQANVDT